jgi:hypothetical protein
MTRETTGEKTHEMSECLSEASRAMGGKAANRSKAAKLGSLAS